MSQAARKRLTAAQEDRLRRATRKMDDARAAWARLVREFGVAASARALGVSPGWVSARVRTAGTGSKDKASKDKASKDKASKDKASKDEASTDGKDEVDHERIRGVIRDRNPSVADVGRRRRSRRTSKD